MLIRKAFKFEIRPNGEQVRKIKQFCGCSRFVFNRALAWQNEQYERDNNHKFGYAKIANLLPQWKKELLWLKDCHSQVLQQSLKDLESAFKNFFQKHSDFIRKLNFSLAHPSGCRQSRHLKRNAFFPKFKKKSVKESFRFPQGCKIEQENDRLYLPKIGWVRYRNSREIVGEIKNVTVSMKCGRFFVSIQTEFEQEIPTHKGGEIGIDMGVARFTANFLSR